MKRNASALWQGDLMNGKGQLTTDSQALSSTPYSFTTRFEEGITGTNPEELIAAAHAGCFSMALSGELAKMKMNPESIQTRASVNIEKSTAGWTVNAVHLTVSARVPGASAEQFRQAADAAKAGCPISRLLTGGTATITMDANLEMNEENYRPEMTY